MNENNPTPRREFGCQTKGVLFTALEKSDQHIFKKGIDIYMTWIIYKFFVTTEN